MCINQSLNVEFLLEDLCNQSVFLIRLEALVLRAARVLKRQCLVLILDLDKQAHILGLPVQNLVVEEDKDYDAFLWVRCILIDPIVVKFKALELVKQDFAAF